MAAEEKIRRCAMIECYEFHLKIGPVICNAASQIDGKIEKWDRLKGNTEFGTR